MIQGTNRELAPIFESARTAGAVAIFPLFLDLVLLRALSSW
jgi:hypothetical protein